MSDYSQPSFYRFNQDSLRLVEFVVGKIATATHILDLGAGSGIIGIELALKLSPEKLTLLELQPEFIPHLKLNAETFLSGLNISIVNDSFSSYRATDKSDLIVCNPPYYLPGHGQRPLDEKRELARSFVRDNWPVLLQTISEVLSPGGRAFLVVKNDQRIREQIGHAALNFLTHEEDDLVFYELSRLEKD